MRGAGKATFRETQTILTHSLNVLKEATMGHVEPNEKKALDNMSPFLASGGYYLVYVEKNVIQGWIGVGRTIDYYTDEVVGIVPELYVMPKYRKHRVAEKLCKEVFKYLRAEGFQKVQLNVFEGNRAKELYYKLGFQSVSTLMEKSLDE